MTDARPSDRLQAGDTFHFAEGTLLEIHDQERGMLRRDTCQAEHFIVLRAEPTNDGRRIGCPRDNEDWGVWAVPTGTPLAEIHYRTVLFYQEGPYAPRALVNVVRIEAAKKRTRYASARRAA